MYKYDLMYLYLTIHQSNFVDSIAKYFDQSESIFEIVITCL